MPSPPSCSGTALCDPPELDAAAGRAPDRYAVEFNTTAGEFRAVIARANSPAGADRLHALVAARFLDGSAFYRAIAGWVVQFGVAADPEVAAAYRLCCDGPAPGAVLPDEPVRATNRRGALAYSAAYADGAGRPRATNRTAELFISLADHFDLDALGFAPLGEVDASWRGGMDAVDAIYTGYGEMRDTCGLHGFSPCRAPNESEVYGLGGERLLARYPRLDWIRTARAVALQSGGAARGEPAPAALARFGAVALVALAGAALAGWLMRGRRAAAAARDEEAATAALTAGRTSTSRTDGDAEESGGLVELPAIELAGVR